jgi:hypothetical protein
MRTVSVIGWNGRRKPPPWYTRRNAVTRSAAANARCVVGESRGKA